MHPPHDLSSASVANLPSTVGHLHTALLQAAGPDAATVITQLGLKNSHLRDELLLLDMKRVSHTFDIVTPLSPTACFRFFGLFSLEIGLFSAKGCAAAMFHDASSR